MRFMKLVAILGTAILLAGCYETGDTSTGTDWGDGGGSVSVRPRYYTCPSNCANVQTRTSCQASESYYQVYVQNAQAGASASVLDQLYQNHSSAASLARSMVQQIGCNP
ncbi:hypothetical protein [Pseudogemmobacter humi]|uniref:Lipoprotein n=1 Tax=Pseudogemmobacter humi TaxID=2483812 RepID=A0A3P5X073_9RHOB|nr:hypothetical protein [Pseudogemmobacter humi]VDC24710.1 hypothetical protein XINFAN_01276 [Pseudogemmobacter humi]